MDIVNAQVVEEEKKEEQWWKGRKEFAGWQLRSFKKLFSKKQNNWSWIWMFGTRLSFKWTLHEAKKRFEGQKQHETMKEAIVELFKLDPLEFAVISLLRCTIYPFLFMFKYLFELMPDGSDNLGICFCGNNIRKIRPRFVTNKNTHMCLKCGLLFNGQPKAKIAKKKKAAKIKQKGKGGRKLERHIDTV